VLKKKVQQQKLHGGCGKLTLNVRDSSRNRRFSVGTKPAKKILIPSLTENGRVTTPYAPGFPYKQQMKSDR